MIHDVDTALRRLLTASLEDEKAEVAFDAPTAAWAAGQDRPAVNLFLYDVREEAEGRTGDWTDVRDDDGRVVGRQPPARHYRLAYILSVWAGDAEEEHRILGRILETVPEREAIPPELLPHRVLEQGFPVTLRLGLPSDGPSATDLFSALGSPPRATCHLTVVVPIRPALDTQLEKPAARMDLGVKKEPPRPRPTAPGRQVKRWSDSRIQEEAG